jgi:hypothetical protein
MQDDKQPIFKSYKSRQALCEAADEAASGVSSPVFRSSVFLYYIARYLVAVYEARCQELPIQVWNEYRNALDHFMRHVAAGGNEAQDDAHHLHRMEGHIQRAVLDVTKILCVKSHDAITHEIEAWGPNILDAIDGGSFRADIRRSLMEATDLLEEAKTNDAQLGHDAWVNRFVIERFLDSFFKFDQIVRVFDEKHLALVNLKLHFDRIENQSEETHKRILEEAKAEIRPQALRRSVYVGIVTGIIAGMLTGIPLVFFGWWLAMTFPAPASAPLAQVISTNPMPQMTPAPVTAPPAP